MDISDGELVRLARDGDPVAFRLLVERHQPMARARAAAVCRNRSDVDDIVQESFLQAFVALDRLRDPDRFAGWLAGIVLNISRNLQRHAPPVLLPEWPEPPPTSPSPLHLAAADGTPSADDIDRADALRAAIASLPAGQRRAVALYYYADQPADRIAESAGAARASLHKARLRLRAYIAEHRPDLVPAASRRTHMTSVHIAHVEQRPAPARQPQGRVPTHLVVLADDAGRRELPIWLLDFDGRRLSELLDRPAESQDQAGAAGAADAAGAAGAAGVAEARTADELTAELLRAASSRVTGVDIEELGPEVAAARIRLTGPAGPQQVTARLAEGLAIAIAAGAPLRVADAVMDRLARPATGPAGPAQVPEPTPAPVRAPGPGLSLDALERGLPVPAPSRPAARARFEPRNLAFADGLDGWLFGGSFTEHASESHWDDYSCAVQDGSAVISSAVPEPTGIAFLGQEVFADDYRGAVITFRGEFRTADAPGRAGLFLRVNEGQPIEGPMTDRSVFADPDNNIVTVPVGRDWASHEVSAQVPDDPDAIVFGVFLTGPGQIELRNAELTRGRTRS
jgi:RNA polymerase sigma-70 factor, ECF subfamily